MENHTHCTAIDAILNGLSNEQPAAVNGGPPATNKTLIVNNSVIDFEGARYTVRHDPHAAEQAQVVLTSHTGEISMSAEDFGKRYLDAHTKRIDAARKIAKAADKAITSMESRPIESYSPEIQAEIQERLVAVRHVDRIAAEHGRRPKEGDFAKAGILARQDCQSLNIGPANRAPASPKKVRGLYDRWTSNDRDEAALAPLHHRKGDRKRDPDDRRVRLMAVVIGRHYLKMERPNISVAHQILKGMIQADVKRGKLPSATKPPSYETFRKEIARSSDARKRLTKREGGDAGSTLRITKPGIVAERPLQYVYIDHTPLDGFALVLVRGRYYAVRPWLTAGIDLYTRGVWSAVISLSAPSTRTLSELLRIGALPKNPAEWGAQSPYAMHGIPEVILADRGPEFLSKYWALTALRLGFEFRICPEASLKGVIERLFGTVASSFCSGLPGRCFANVMERGAYEAAANAALLMPELTRQFMLWLIDVNHNRPRKALDRKTPIEAWEDAMQDPDMRPLTVTDIDAFLIAISPVATRTINNKGVRVGGGFYSSNDAQRLFAKHGAGKTYEVRYDPIDRSKIFLLDPDEHRWLTLSCMTPKLIADLDFADWLKTVRFDDATGHVEDVAAAAQLKNAEERRKIKAAQKKGLRPKTGDKAADVKKVVASSRKPANTASCDNARKSTTSKTATPRGKNAVKY